MISFVLWESEDSWRRRVYLFRIFLKMFDSEWVLTSLRHIVTHWNEFASWTQGLWPWQLAINSCSVGEQAAVGGLLKGGSEQRKGKEEGERWTQRANSPNLREWVSNWLYLLTCTCVNPLVDRKPHCVAPISLTIEPTPPCYAQVPITSLILWLTAA